MRLGKLGPQLDDFPETGNGLFVAAELRERVAEVVVRLDRLRIDGSRLAEDRQRFLAPGLPNQSDAEGVVRVDPVRMEFDFLPQHGFGTAEVSECEVEISEKVGEAYL